MTALVKARLPSLELNWLPMSLRKGISTPRIVYGDPGFPCGGVLYFRTEYRRVLDGIDLDTKEGSVICIADPEQERPHTLTHEWRHHWQHESDWDLSAPWPYHHQETTEAYEREIRRYFRMPYELDALLFQHRHAPDDISDYWLSLVMPVKVSYIVHKAA